MSMYSVPTRRRRVVVDSAPATYHCISRIAGGEKLLGPVEKEIFRKFMRKQAAFCGVEILTYAIMSNHFHLLVRILPQEKLTDDQLVERVRALYGDETARAVKRALPGEEKGPRIREQLHARMGDVSVFLKELKQRFSIWYNKTHGRFGTLWAERFKSVLVEPEAHVLAKVAGYIDLNPVRAGLCKDPKDYRFCGYAEAVGGSAEARQGLGKVFVTESWRETQRAYRLLLFGKGYYSDLDQGRIDEKVLRKVLAEEGELTLADALRCRIRYFSDGMALGSAAFIEGLFHERMERWKKRKDGARPMAGARWGGLCTLNRMRGDVIR